MNDDRAGSWASTIRLATVTAHHCPLCGTFHPELRPCPDLVPGYGDSSDGKADAADQRKWDQR